MKTGTVDADFNSPGGSRPATNVASMMQMLPIRSSVSAEYVVLGPDNHIRTYECISTPPYLWTG